MKKIVTIGGGTGQFMLLSGLRKKDVDLTALVSMVDDGGSTGELRDEFGVLPAGDLRRCLTALSKDSGVLRELFEYRFENDCVGNRIIAAVENIVGKENYVQELGRILNIDGKVLPITIDNTHVYAETNKGKKLNGQLEVSYNLENNEKIEKIWLEPRAYIFKDAAEEIRKADLIVICPGDLYGSILPNFLVKGMKQVLKKTNAKIIYVCNLVTKQGTHNFKASDFKKEIEKYVKVDKVICNIKKPTKKVVDKYKKEDSYFVQPDLKDAMKKDLLDEYQSGKTKGKVIARHNPEKTSRAIMSLI